MSVVVVRIFRAVGVVTSVAVVVLSTSRARADAGVKDAAPDVASSGVDAAAVDASSGPDAGAPQPPPIGEADAGDPDAPTRFIDTGNDGACSVGGIGQASGACATFVAVACALAVTLRRKR
jgi:hypothetical protein